MPPDPQEATQATLCKASREPLCAVRMLWDRTGLARLPSCLTPPHGPSPCSAEAALLLSLTNQSTGDTCLLHGAGFLQLGKGRPGREELGLLSHSAAPTRCTPSFLSSRSLFLWLTNPITTSPHHRKPTPNKDQYSCPSQTHVRTLPFNVSSGDRALESRTEW